MKTDSVEPDYNIEDLNEAVEVLKKGGIILYPTDTIWGIGCDATNSRAVKRIYELKNRKDSKSMIVLVSSIKMLDGIVSFIPQSALMLIDASVRPLTIVYDTAINVAPNLIASDGSIGVRITQELFSKRLCENLKRPLVSTSANLSGHSAPLYFKDIDEEIIKGVDYVVKYRQDDMTQHNSSKIIKVNTDGTFKIIRE